MEKPKPLTPERIAEIVDIELRYGRLTAAQWRPLVEAIRDVWQSEAYYRERYEEALKAVLGAHRDIQRLEAALASARDDLRQLRSGE